MYGNAEAGCWATHLAYCTASRSPWSSPHHPIVLPAPPTVQPSLPALQPGPCPPSAPSIVLPASLHCTAPTPHCTHRILASGSCPLPPLYCPRCTARVLASGGAPEGYSDYLTDKPPPLGLPTGIPSRDGSTSVYDYKFEVASRTWRLWTDTIEKLAIPNGAQFADIIIPTKDSAR